MKRCPRCTEEKPFDEFGDRKSHGKIIKKAMCIPCEKEYKAEHYQKNKVRYYESRTAKKNEIKEAVWELKRKPCVECGNSYNPWQMQFDHVRGEKIAGISQLISNRQYHLVWDEIEKCELVCANCHADRTYRRMADTDELGLLD